jgi:hypothetical protein
LLKFDIGKVVEKAYADTNPIFLQGKRKYRAKANVAWLKEQNELKDFLDFSIPDETMPEKIKRVTAHQKEQVNLLDIDNDLLERTIVTLNDRRPYIVGKERSKKPPLKEKHSITEDKSEKSKIEKQIVGIRDERIRIDKEINLCQSLIDNGIRYEISRCKTDRSVAYDSLSHLNSSKDFSRQGYSFWKALSVNELWEIDLKSADIVAASIITNDELLLEEVLTKDIYLLATHAMVLSDELRDDVKTWFLQQQYGKTDKTMEKEHKKGECTIEELNIFKKLRIHREERYKKYTRISREVERIGDSTRVILPTGILSRHVVSYRLLAHVCQSLVAAMITDFYIRLDKEGFEPVFDIHDSVVVRKEPNNVVNEYVVQIIEMLLERYGVVFNGLRHCNLVKIEKIEYDTDVTSLGDRILPNGDKLILNKKGRFTIEEIEFLESKMPEIWKEIAKHK